MNEWKNEWMEEWMNERMWSVKLFIASFNPQSSTLYFIIRGFSTTLFFLIFLLSLSWFLTLSLSLLLYLSLWNWNSWCESSGENVIICQQGEGMNAWKEIGLNRVNCIKRQCVRRRMEDGGEERERERNEREKERKEMRDGWRIESVAKWGNQCVTSIFFQTASSKTWLERNRKRENGRK